MKEIIVKAVTYLPFNLVQVRKGTISWQGWDQPGEGSHCYGCNNSPIQSVPDQQVG